MKASLIVVDQPAGVESREAQSPHGSASPSIAAGCGKTTEPRMHLRETHDVITTLEEFFWRPSATVPLFGPVFCLGASSGILPVKASRSKHTNGISLRLKQAEKAHSIGFFEMFNDVEQCGCTSGKRVG